MAEIQRQRLALFMTADTIQGLREMALKQGYVITSGPGVGRGSVSALLEALVEGQVQVSREASDDIRSIIEATASATATLMANEVLGKIVNLKPEATPARS